MKGASTGCWCRERRVHHTADVVKGALMSPDVINAPFTTHHP
jgi:hypothetical protein